MAEIKAKSSASILEEMGQVIEGIPFNQLTMEQTPITDLLGWRSPQGLGFRISGCFLLYANGSDPNTHYNNPPRMSDNLLKGMYEEEYQGYLKEAGGDEQEAMQMLTKEELGYLGKYQPLRSFIGRWLTVDENPYEVFPSEEVLPWAELTLSVEGDVKAGYEQEPYFGYLEDIAPGSDNIVSCYYTVKTEEIFWYQPTARASRGGCKIELVELPELGLQIITPQPEQTSPLWLPESMASRYQKGPNYQPNISTTVEPRPRPVDQEMMKIFSSKNEYRYWKGPQTGLLIAVGRVGEITPAKTSSSPQEQKRIFPLI